MTLTPRESQVLCLLCLGKMTKEIAADLKISEKTVQYFRARLSKKTGTVERVGLIRWAIKNNYITITTFLTPS